MAANPATEGIAQRTLLDVLDEAAERHDHAVALQRPRRNARGLLRQLPRDPGKSEVC